MQAQTQTRKQGFTWAATPFEIASEETLIEAARALPALEELEQQTAELQATVSQLRPLTRTLAKARRIVEAHERAKRRRAKRRNGHHHPAAEQALLFA